MYNILVSAENTNTTTHLKIINNSVKTSVTAIKFIQNKCNNNM